VRGGGAARPPPPRPLDRFKARARALRASQTSAEAKLWQALRNRKLARWKFRRHHPIDRYIVDFVTLDGKLIVEVDGVTHSEPSEIQRDKARSEVLEACGFFIIRVSNTDVYENLEGVLELIESTLRFE
jgi:very-short-patch-repair endonuclease